MDWMLMPLRRYAQFSGRSQRKEFWMYVLFLVIAQIILSMLDIALGLGGSVRTIDQRTAAGFNAAVVARSSGVLTSIFALATLIPTLAVSVRRLHDTDRSGWWILAPILPYAVGGALFFMALSAAGAAIAGLVMLIGAVLAIAVLVFYCLDGTRGPNRFGPDPKGPDLANTFA